MPKMQLIPARGRKLVVVGFKFKYFHDATYPREGTETHMPCHFIVLHMDATYPREGTETFPFVNNEHLGQDATYPREGTETYSRYGRV